MRIRNIIMAIMLSVTALIATSCACATKSQVDRLGGLTLEVLEENDELVETHPRYQVTDDMDPDERELTEELKQAKKDRNDDVRKGIEALTEED